MSVRLIILKAAKNELVLMAEDIGNYCFTDSCDETIWSFCGAEFDPRCGTVVILISLYMD